MALALCGMFLYSAVSILQPTLGAWSDSDVHTIRGSILSNTTYHKLIRPAENMTVNVSLSLLTVNYLDVKTQTLSTTGWLTVEWRDERLSWNATKYPDVDHVYTLDSEVWKPELFIDNSVADVSILQDSNVMFKVLRDGVVEWKLPRIFTTFCDVDVTYYPFDTQNCVIEITSWAYTIDEISLRATRDSVHKEDLKPHGEWTVISSSTELRELHETKVNGYTEIFSQLDFFIKMQRKSNYYITSVLLPVILTSYLNIFVFLLPTDSGEKVGFILTVLLALAVLLTLVSDSIPSTSINTSVLSVYLAVTLCLGVVCCFLTVLVIKINFKEQDTPISNGWRLLYDKILVPCSCWNKCFYKSARGKKSVSPIHPKDEIVVMNYDGEKNESSPEPEPSDELKWTHVATVLDHFFLVVMGIVTTISSITFMVALSAGGALNQS